MTMVGWSTMRTCPARIWRTGRRSSSTSATASRPCSCIPSHALMPGSICRGCWLRSSERTGGTIAQHVGEKEPKALQRFLNLANWDADRLRDLNRDYVVENLADPEGILIADPTGFAKKGKKSAGVQRQYSGTLGRIDNCQIGTFLAYVNGTGDRVLIDRELYIPEKSWFGDPQRCAEAGIPVELTFATRPRQVIAMIRRTLQAGLPVR